MRKVFLRAAMLAIAAILAVQSAAPAQKTTQPVNDGSGGNGTQTTEVTKDALGNTTTTNTAEIKFQDGTSYTRVTENTVNPQGHIVFAKYEYTVKNKKGEVTSTTIDTSNYHYDASGGYVLESYHGSAYPQESVGYDIHWVIVNDKNGNTLSGDERFVKTKSDGTTETINMKFVNGQWVEVGSTPSLNGIEAKPGDGAANESAYLPDVAGPSSEIVGTVDDPDQSGPSAQVLVQYEDRQGRSKFFKTLTDVHHLVHLRALADTARITLFKAFDRAGKPDGHAVHCEIAQDGVVKGTDAVARLPARGPAITRASSAYERGARGLVNLQTRGLDAGSTILTLDGSPQGIRTLALSDMSAKGQIESETPLGTHTVGAMGANGRTNDVPTDVVALRPDPLAPTRPGVVQTLTVHCDGLPANHPAVMYFSVSGAAQLADGGETTSVPVKDGIAQVRIRGARAGQALVRFKLHVVIPGFWDA